MTQVYMVGINYALPVEMEEDEGKWYLSLPAPWTSEDAKHICEEVKCMAGRKWNGDTKMWEVPKTPRNHIAMNYLLEDAPDPFARYDLPITDVEVTRPLWQHQKDMLNHILTRHYCILAAEQGTGKSLPIIEAMERSGFKGTDIWYISTVAGLVATREQLEFWQSKVTPVLMTYDGLVKRVDQILKGKIEPHIPRMIVFDESSKLKGPNTNRSNAAQYIADAIRGIYGEEGFVIEATGTPAPKSPLDWWKQVEVAQPGYLKEGTIKQFEKTLFLQEYIESDQGTSFPKIVTWYDDEHKCKHCGKYVENHGPRKECFKKNYKGKDLYFEKSVDELSRLYERLYGLVIIQKKADCLDLPDKHYRKIYCEPTAEILNMANTITEMSPSAIEALTKLRELSDGFQYITTEVGKKPCPVCSGSGEGGSYEESEEEYEEDDWFEGIENLEYKEGACYRCSGTGEISIERRTYLELPSPKLIRLSELVDDQEEVGRVVIFAGFQASIDRITKMMLEKQWDVLQVTGRGWIGRTYTGERIRKKDFIRTFQDKSRARDRVALVGHPEAAGMALTLTESQVEIYFSNSFSGEARMQSEDRCHRYGMDMVKGLTISDLIHLPTDELVLENLSNKVRMQDVTLGVVKERLEKGFVTHARTRK
jgi:SNF2 family DNA or RNA helicase